MYLDEEPAVTDLSPDWQRRFDFFTAYGPPACSGEARAAFKGLSYRERFRIGSNVFAYFFGPLYFITLGMWRKALTILGISICLALTVWLLDLPDALATATACGIGGLSMSTANYAYFLHITTGSRSWNPYQGMGRRR